MSNELEDLVGSRRRLQIMSDMLHLETGIASPEDPNRKARYISYRLASVWLRGKRKYRSPLPVCVVDKVRALYPSESYVGFHFADD